MLAKRFKFLYSFSFRLFGFLLTMLPAFVFCQGQFSLNCAVAETGPHYCPGSEKATGTSYTKSRIKCAVECILNQCCTCLGYYDTSRKCYFYSFVPQKLIYDHDCTFMMVSFQYKLAKL